MEFSVLSLSYCVGSFIAICLVRLKSWSYLLAVKTAVAIPLFPVFPRRGGVIVCASGSGRWHNVRGVLEGCPQGSAVLREHHPLLLPSTFVLRSGLIW